MTWHLTDTDRETLAEADGGLFADTLAAVEAIVAPYAEARDQAEDRLADVEEAHGTAIIDLADMRDERDAAREVLAERDATIATLRDGYRDAIGVPESEHQRRRMEDIATAYESALKALARVEALAECEARGKAQMTNPTDTQRETLAAVDLPHTTTDEMADIVSSIVAPYAEALEDAWNEGYEACINDTEARSAPPGPNGPVDPTMNPYRAAAALASVPTPGTEGQACEAGDCDHPTAPGLIPLCAEHLAEFKAWREVQA